MDITYTIGWATLDSILLSQIEVTDSLDRGPGFRQSLLYNSLLCAMIKALALYIIDTKMNVITVNPKLRLASNDINSDTFYFSFTDIHKLQKTCAPFLVLILEISAGVGDCHAIWCKTIADQRTDIEDQDSENSEDLIDESNIDLTETRKLLPLQDNIPHIANKSLIEQGVARRNRKVVSIISLCLPRYSRSE